MSWYGFAKGHQHQKKAEMYACAECRVMHKKMDRRCDCLWCELGVIPVTQGLESHEQ